jgi:transcriptional regulator with PAS, ATPase and Fis domain
LGALRPDLYYRVADVELHTVPLREMKERDISNIACNLAYRLMWQPVVDADGESVLTPDIIRSAWDLLARSENSTVLAGYAWPGNMRELSTLIKRFILLGDDIFSELRHMTKNCIVSDQLPVAVCSNELQRFLLPFSDQAELETRRLNLRELQSVFVRHVVASLGGRENIQPTKLAEALGCSYNTLISHLQESQEHE